MESATNVAITNQDKKKQACFSLTTTFCIFSLRSSMRKTSCQIKDMFIACQPPYHWRCFGNGYYYTLFRGFGLVIILIFCHTWSAFEDIVQTLLMHWRKILKCVFVCFSALVTSDNASRTIYLLCKLIIRLKIICKLKNPSATNYCYMSYNKAESRAL